MYAIIQTGGKQYKVQAGDRVRVEKLEQDLGAEFELNEVLFIGGDEAIIGTPLVENAKVRVVVTRQEKSPKIIIFKKKRRQGYRRTQGHRQPYTELFIKAIEGPGGLSASTEEAAPVVSLKERRQKKLEEKMAAKKEEAAAAPKKATATKKKTAKKKVAKKTVAKKKTVKKKASGAKKTTKKTAAKK